MGHWSWVAVRWCCYANWITSGTLCVEEGSVPDKKQEDEWGWEGKRSCWLGVSVAMG